MTTYMTDKHGQRWALVPVEPTGHMTNAGWEELSCVGSCGEASPPDRCDFIDVHKAMISEAPDFEPREVSDAELGAIWRAHCGSKAVPGQMTFVAMRAALALHNA